MSKYIIEGGCKLSGSVSINGNKNAALPCIAVSLLTSEPVVLHNIPLIEDVRVMCNIATHLGAQCNIDGDNNTVSICTSSIRTTVIPKPLASQIRASILFAGVLSARCGSATLPPPGGDIIGRRRLDNHIMGLEMLGATCIIENNLVFHANTPLQGTRILLDEASVTATENIIIAAVLATGNTIIENAASEPHVQDVCNMLQKMGAKINGVGSNVLHITGVSNLTGVEFTIGSDYMELGSFIGLAAATNSAITIDNVGDYPLQMIEKNFRKLGVYWKRNQNSLSVDCTNGLEVLPDMDGSIPSIDDSPWPGFPADLISIVLVVATQARGTVLIHEKMYESRLFFVDKLINMGAHIVLCDPHRVVVSGPAPLRGAVLTSPDVRAGMAILIAALCATGISEIHNVYQIKRGYYQVEQRLVQLGASIKERD